MSEKYAIPDHIRIVNAVCVDYGNIHNTWSWIFLDIRDALDKVKELLVKLELGERLSAEPQYCGQIASSVELLELIPTEDEFELGGYGICHRLSRHKAYARSPVHCMRHLCPSLQHLPLRGNSCPSLGRR